MRKSLKLSGVNSRLVGFYQANGFLFTPEVDKEHTFTVVVADPASSSKNILSKIWCWEASKLLCAATSLPLTRKETSLGRRELGKRKWERSPAILRWILVELLSAIYL